MKIVNPNYRNPSPQTAVELPIAADLIGFEKDIASLWEDGQIRTPVHLAGGNEDQLISIFRDIRRQDWVFSTYRSHYHALLKGVDPVWLRQQILGGNSMHINSREKKFFTSSIVGGCLPIALGVAIANQRDGRDEKVWVFIGEMAAEMGVTHETVNYAVGHDLHNYLTIVIEDNGHSVNTPTKEAWGRSSTYPSLVKYYKYERTWGHQGTGVFVSF